MIRELEKTGKTVEEAYAAACQELGVSTDDINVSYEIIDMPARKLFRSIPAKVLVKVETEDVVNDAVVEEKPVAVAPAQEAVVVEQPKEEVTAEEVVASTAAVIADEKAFALQDGEVSIDVEQAPKVKAAMDYLQSVIVCMGVQNFTMQAIEKGGATIIRIQGEHLGVLIGRRGETMESLSYLASLVANRVEGDYIKFGLDVAGYRDKREQELTALARRLGERVIKNNRAFSMEPMNPYERRLIHAAIGEMDGVRSESLGEGKDRRVVIYSTAEGADNNPETENRGRFNGRNAGARGGRSNGRGPSRGNTRGGRDGNRGSRDGSRPARGPRNDAPRAKSLPERDFTPVDASSATPVAPKRTERIDDMADFGFGKIEF